MTRVWLQYACVAAMTLAIFCAWSASAAVTGADIDASPYHKAAKDLLALQSYAAVVEASITTVLPPGTPDIPGIPSGFTVAAVEFHDAGLQRTRVTLFDTVDTSYLVDRKANTITEMKGFNCTPADDSMAAQGLIPLLGLSTWLNYTVGTLSFRGDGVKSIRGMSAEAYSANGTFFLPTSRSKSGGTFSADYWITTGDWKIDGGPTRQFVGIDLVVFPSPEERAGLDFVKFTFSISNFRAGTTVLPTMFSTVCHGNGTGSLFNGAGGSPFEQVPQTPSETAVPGLTTGGTFAHPFPAFPKEFSMAFEANMIDERKSFSGMVFVSTALQRTRTTVILPSPDSKQRRVEYDVLALNDMGVVFEQTQKQTTSSGMGSVPEASCLKTLFKGDLFRSVSDLFLLASAHNPPRFLGRENVRGVQAQAWAGDLKSGLQVTWYFSDPKWDVTSSTAFTPLPMTLLRMAVRGRGIVSPFFVHHPFYPTGEPVPEDMVRACEETMEGMRNPQCSTVTTPEINHIYDFFAMMPSVDASEFAIPYSCKSMVRVSAPSIPACPETGTSFGEVMLILILMLLSGIVGGVFAHIRLKFKLQKDLEQQQRASIDER